MFALSKLEALPVAEGEKAAHEVAARERMTNFILICFVIEICENEKGIFMKRFPTRTCDEIVTSLSSHF